MLRIFIRLYIFLLLPITLYALLPTNPIKYFGNVLMENHFDHEFSSVYQLVNAELADQAESEWANSVEKLAPYFPNGLFIKPVDQWDLKPKQKERLFKQGYILNRKTPMALLYRMRKTNQVLRFNLFLPDDDFNLLEKQTRGIRYFINKNVLQNGDVEKKFATIKPLFKVPLSLKTLDDFSPKSKIGAGLRKDEIYYDRNEDDPLFIYFKAKNNQHVVVAGPLNNSHRLQTLYNYAGYIVPAFLIAIGVLLWLYTLMRELRTMNRGSKLFGQGKLSTRVHLSKFSTLHLLSNSFNQMASKVEQLVNGHQDLTNAVSHELKTPLARLRFALQMQQESNNKNDQEKYTHKIKDNIDELETLINELLDYARLDRDTGLLKPQAHNLTHWLNEEIALLKEYQPDLHISVKLDDSADSSVLFDQPLMNKVLNNLLNNASRHAQKQIQISAYIKKSHAYLLIEDDGEGVKSSVQKELFKPFFRADKSRQRQTGGSGLGLAISQKIIKLHKGTISYQDSTLGGAGFLLKWPTD